jgi:hypothetical protein
MAAVMARWQTPEPDAVALTAHAVQRFRERIDHRVDPVVGLRELTRHALQRPGRIHLKGGRAPSRHYVVADTVVVVSGDYSVVVTVYRLPQPHGCAKWRPTATPMAA